MMLKRAIVVPILVAGLLTLWMGVALADSHGADGNATSTDSGLEGSNATSTDSGLDDPNATSTDPDLDDPNATSTDAGLDDPNATSTDAGLDDPNATSTDPGLDDPNATSTDPGLDDPNATSTDSIVILDDGDDNPKRKSFPGVVHYYPGDDMISVASNDGETETYVGYPDPDIIKTPGGPNNRGTFGDGARVVVHAEWVDGQWVAIWVIVKPDKPTFNALVGTVISTEDGVTTIVLPNGKTKKIKNPKGEQEPEDGEVVTVFVDESGDGENTGGGDENGDGEPAKVTGLVKASKVADRIQSFLEKLAAKDGSLPQAAIDARQQLVTNLAAVLDEYSAQQVSIIEKVSKAQGIGSGTAAGLQKALDKAQADRDKGKAIADDAKNKVGVAPGASNIGNGGSASSGSGDDDDGDGDSSNGSGKPSETGKRVGAGSKGAGKGG